MDNSGAIDKKEMTKVMKSIYAMLSNSSVSREASEEEAAAHAAKLLLTWTGTVNSHKRSSLKAGDIIFIVGIQSFSFILFNLISKST